MSSFANFVNNVLITTIIITGGVQGNGILEQLLRRILEPKKDENGEWTRLHNKDLHSLYRSPNIVRVIKSRRLRWAGHVARIGENRVLLKC